MSDLDKAGMQIDIDGSGVMDVFNPYLPVSYIHSRFSLPTKNSQNYQASHDFDIDPNIINPFFYVSSYLMTSDRFYYYFTHLGGVRWRVTLWGVGGRSGGGSQPWSPRWEEPLMNPNVIVVVGGYRG